MEWLAKVMTTEGGGIWRAGDETWWSGGECISIPALSFLFGAMLPFANG